MEIEAPRTREKLDGPKVKQFAVFLQNKVGTLLDLVKMVSDQNIMVLGLSVTELSDSAIVRLVVSDPESTEQLFAEHGIAFSVREVLVVELPGSAADLNKLLACLLMAEVNVHCSYPLLIQPRGNAALTLHVEDDECASSVLGASGFKMLSQTELSR